MLPSPTVFGFSFSELVVVAIVALVVMGPKDLPKMLRRLGQWAGKIRRAAADLRAQSGIDDALRSEGLADDIAEIRKLARGELDAVQRVARIDDSGAAARAPSPDPYARGADFHVVRDREYPREGADSYNALPDNAIVYIETLPKSKLSRDALYVLGDADAELPPEPAKEPAGAVGPTLIGGVGLAAPSATTTDADAPVAKTTTDEVGPTLVGIAPSEADGPSDENPAEPKTPAEAR